MKQLNIKQAKHNMLGRVDKMYVISASHREAKTIPQRYGMVDGTYQTMTQATSLRGLSRDARIMFLDSKSTFPDRDKILELLASRFTNVTYLDENGQQYAASPA